MRLPIHGRTRRPTGQPLSGIPRGVSVLEILVALTLFGAVAVSMGGLSIVVARRAEANDVFTKRTAILQQQMNWMQALPYDSLLSKQGTTTVSGGPFPHTRQITVSQSGSRTRVTVKITPTRAPGSVETLSFDRARPTTSPLCKGC